MKTSFLQKISFLLPAFAMSFFLTNAQVASWTFNNILTGTGSANSIAGNASLGSTIASGGAYNGGTVYYGEGPWPAGGIDLNAYLEFSVTPTAGHTITLSSLVMQIRRSTTGSSGAGPNTWSLRSSLDAYAADISSGILTMNSSPATIVSLGIAFINLPSKITFRLYGYNATVSSGGLNRFVYDDIVASGSTVLPVALDYFKVKPDHETASISWGMGSEGNISAIHLERSSDGTDFKVVKIYTGNELLAQKTFEYIDQLNHPSGNFAYRLRMISADGHSTYSSVQAIFFQIESGFTIQAIQTGSGDAVYFRVNAMQSGNYLFTLINLYGNKITEKSVQLGMGSQVLQMDNRPLKPGIYILLAENANQKISTKLMVF